MMGLKKAVVFDIDNTLIDSRKRFYKSLEIATNGRSKKTFKELDEDERSRFWDIFLNDKFLYLDEPIKEAINELLERYKDGYHIIILTGRPEKMRDATIKQLRRFKIPFHELYMRPEDDYDPDYIYKPRQLKKIMDRGFKIVEYHEDSPKTLEVVNEKYPWISICRHGFGDMF